MRKFLQLNFFWSGRHQLVAGIYKVDVISLAKKQTLAGKFKIIFLIVVISIPQSQGQVKNRATKLHCLPLQMYCSPTSDQTVR